MVRRLLQEKCAFEAIQLWLPHAFTRGVHERQRFREHREPGFWLS
jgi:hypothetical protein